MKKLNLSPRLKRAIPVGLIILGAGALVWTAQPGSAKPSPQSLAAACQSKPSGAQLECWNSLLGQTATTYGLTATFNLVDYLYQNDPSFASNCHAFAHTIGQKSYEIWAQGRTLDVTPSVSSCGYGFYHGFMEALVGQHGQITQARDFCLKVDQQLSKFGSKDASSCFHGIGHGTATPHDPALYGHPQAMIDPALALCASAATDTKQREDCNTGVYSAIATFMSNREYGLSVSRDDPLALCPRQAQSYESACYIGMVVALSSLTQNSLPLAAAYIEKIPNDDIAQSMIKSMTGPVIYSDPKRTDFSQQILDCRSLQSRLRQSCLLGFASGIYEFHGSKDGLTSVFNFCSTGLMNADEHKACFDHILGVIRETHSATEIDSACRELPSEDQPYCEKTT